MKKLFTATVLFGSAAGAALSYRHRLQKNAAVSAAEILSQNSVAFSALTAEQLRSGSASVSLLGYLTCPYTGTVRAFLDYSRVPYSNIEVEPIFKAQLKEAGCVYSKVPQVKISTTTQHEVKTDDDGEQQHQQQQQIWLADSQIIVNSLATKLAPDLLSSADDRWRNWSRDIFARLIVVNINRSLSEAVANYSYIDQYADTISLVNRTFLKIIGAPVMFAVSKLITPGRLKKHGVSIEKGDDVRQILASQLNDFTSNGLSGDRRFLGGKKPSLADLDTFGIVRSLDGHTVQQEMFSMNPRFKQWAEDMEALVPRQKELIH